MPTAIPTLTELATIAHTNRYSVVATHRRHVLLDDTASPLPFLGMRFGLAVEAVAALTTIGRSSWPSTVPARRSPSTRLPVESKAMSNASLRSIPHAAPLGLATRPCRRPVWALANLVWLDRVLATTLDAPLGDPPQWLELGRLHPP